MVFEPEIVINRFYPEVVATGPPGTGGGGGTSDHLLLSNIGTIAHAAIDTALGRLADTSGTNTGDQDITGITVNESSISAINALLALPDPLPQYLLAAAAITTHAELPDKGTNDHAAIDTALTALTDLLARTTNTNSGDQDLSPYALISTVLLKGNTDDPVFIPDLDNDPANKKFVEDLVASISLSGVFQLSGVSGGQTGHGGTDPGDNLTLGSTTDPSKGDIELLDQVVAYNGAVFDGTGMTGDPVVAEFKTTNGDNPKIRFIRGGDSKGEIGAGFSNLVLAAKTAMRFYVGGLGLVQLGGIFDVTGKFGINQDTPTARLHSRGAAGESLIKADTSVDKTVLEVTEDGLRSDGSIAEQAERKVTTATATTTVNDLYIIVDPTLNSIVLTIHSPSLLVGQKLKIIFPYGYVGANTVTYEGTIETTGSQLLPGEELWIYASGEEIKWLGD